MHRPSHREPVCLVCETLVVPSQATALVVDAMADRVVRVHRTCPVPDTPRSPAAGLGSAPSAPRLAGDAHRA